MEILTLNGLTSSRYFCLSNFTPPRESKWKASIPNCACEVGRQRP